MNINTKTALFLFVFAMALHAQAQTCQTAIPQTTPTADFVIHNDGTVSHTKTALMWKVCSEGQTWVSGAGCEGSATAHTWATALQIPAGLNAGGGYAGYQDWRLPDIKELSSIVELSCSNSAINLAVFPATASSRYWSSSPVARRSYNAWIVNFHHGGDNLGFRNGLNHVRLVRGGQ